MKTLMIKDLSVTEQLDSKAMRAVRGGFGPSYYSFAPVFAPTSVKTTSTTQLISNDMNFQVANGNNVALAEGISTDFSPYINSQNQNGH